MAVTVIREQEILREALDVLWEHLSPAKVIRLWTAWQMGEGDYLALRDQLFEGESVATLYEKVLIYQEHGARGKEGRQRLYHILIEPTDGTFRAYVPAIPALVAHGDTSDAARERLTAALQKYLAECQAKGTPPPVERAHVETVVIRS